LSDQGDLIAQLFQVFDGELGWLDW